MGKCCSKPAVREQDSGKHELVGDKGKEAGDKAFLFGVQPNASVVAAEQPPSTVLDIQSLSGGSSNVPGARVGSAGKTRAVTPSDIEASFVPLKASAPGVEDEKQRQSDDADVASSGNNTDTGSAKGALAIDLFQVPQGSRHAADEEEVELARKREKMLQQSEIACKVLPNLYVSGEHVSMHRELLEQYGITKVMNVAGLTSDNHFPESVAYWTLDLQDSLDEDMSGWFAFAVQLYRAAQAQEGGICCSKDSNEDGGFHWCRHTCPSSSSSSSSSTSSSDKSGNLLVHCTQGVSRSCSLVIAIVMAIRSLSYDEAFAAVRSTRTVCRPNDSFVRQLREWEQFVLGKGVWFRLERREDCGRDCVVPCLVPDDFKADARASYIVVPSGGKRNMLVWTAAEHRELAVYTTGIHKAVEALRAVCGTDVDYMGADVSFPSFLSSSSSSSSSSGPQPLDVVVRDSPKGDEKGSGVSGVSKDHRSNPSMPTSPDLSTIPKLRNASSDVAEPASEQPSEGPGFGREHNAKEEHELEWSSDEEGECEEESYSSALWNAEESKDKYAAQGIEKFDWDDIWDDHAYLVWKRYDEKEEDCVNKLFVCLGADFVAPDGISSDDFVERVVAAFKNSAAIDDSNRQALEDSEVVQVHAGDNEEFERCVEKSMF